MSNNQQPDPLAVMQALETIEQQLQQLALWQGQAPSDAALASRLPFCVDTLEFHEWLQFVLLVRFRALLAAQQPLPTQIAVYPMATEVYKQRTAECHGLLAAIAQLDEVITGQPMDRTT